LPELSGPLVIECKATGGYSFSRKEEEGPDPGHVAQAFCYAALLNSHALSIIYMNREAKKASALFRIFAYALKADDPKAALAALVKEKDSRPYWKGLPASPFVPTSHFLPFGA